MARDIIEIEQPSVADRYDVGIIGIHHLKRFWSATLNSRLGSAIARKNEAHFDRVVLDCLGIGLNQAIEFICRELPDFTAFEHWVISTAGEPDSTWVARFNADLDNASGRGNYDEALTDPVFTPEDIQHWHQQGYIVLRDAVPQEDLAAAEQAVWKAAGAAPENRSSWYQGNSSSIMIELIQHPAFQKVRKSRRIHRAFSQLWQRSDLWVSADRCSFHPPQTPDHPFPGPDLHWDVNFSRPPGFFTQGILYLTDTPEQQGALTLVPGFQHRMDWWLANSGNVQNPNPQVLHELGSVPVAGRAGDLVIWHHLLPHGSRPNLGGRPRLAQYINCYPLHL